MKKRIRLTRQRDFQRILETRRVFAGRGLVAFGAASDQASSRVGVAVSRKIKGAVGRNRARRRVREAARYQLARRDSESAGRGIAFDVVLIARPDALRLPFAELCSETDSALARLAGR